MPNVNVTWILPVTRVSGKPLAPESIDSVKLDISADGVDFTPFDVYPRDILETTITDLEPGEWFFRGTVVDTAGRQSVPVAASIVIEDTTPPGALQSLTLNLAA
jgi:hypothetical protein